MSKLHTFEVGKHSPAEQWAQPGKPEWPDYVFVEVPRAQAWHIINSLLAQLKECEQDPVDFLELPLFGELSERIE
jgi:hypothetical protein